MIAKYDGTCYSCGSSIHQGDKIAFFGRGRASHAQCAQEIDGETFDEDAIAGLESGTLANDRRMARNGLTVVRFPNGDTMTRNRRGRCEDAPCCGCCTF